MEIDIFLKEGEQTKIAENISKISSEFTEAGFDLIIQITKWIHKNTTVRKRYRRERNKRIPAGDVKKAKRR